MAWLSWVAVIFLSVFAFVLLVFHIKSYRPVRSIILNALIGIAALVLVNITARFTGVHIPVNWWSLGGSAIFGIPAVCALIVLQIIV